MTPMAAVDGLVIVPAGGGPALVDGVGFAVAPGEVLGLVGPSGSGKTTAALTLLGHVRPGLRRAAGAVSVGGHDPFRDPAAVRGRLAGYLGQDPAQTLNPGRRIGPLLDEVIRLRLPGRPSGAEVSAELERLLDAVDLPADRAFLLRYPHQLSGGQAQRFALALAMAGSPPLLLLDEPTSGLDLLVQRRVRMLLHDILRRRGEGRAAVIVSHDLALVGELADRVVAMAEGRVVAEGLPERVLRPIRVSGGRLSPLAGQRSLRRVPVVPSDPPATSRLVVDGLTAWHPGPGRTTVTACDQVTLAVAPGECLAIVGPSGSGKSTIARCVVGLHPASAGEIRLDGAPLPAVARRRTSAQRGAIQLVGQDPVNALNPREGVGEALARPLRRLRGLRGDALDAEVVRLLGLVRLGPALANRRPAQLSGGERQRVNLARALAAGPTLLVCDEVTSALDIETQGAILALLDDLRHELGVALLVVTHDAGCVRRLADRVVVLDLGRIVEAGTVEAVFTAPEHPLTQALVAATMPMHAPDPANPLAQLTSLREPQPVG